MSPEANVLLVEAEALPSSLEEQLDRRGVFAEHAALGSVGQLLPVVVPDLIIQSGNVNLESTLAAIEDADPKPPLAVIADRATLRKLRTEKHSAIKALIPEDLPVAAMAHRLTTLAQRSAEGRSIRPPGQVASKRPAPAPTGGSGPVSSQRGLRAPQPLAPEQRVKIVDPDVEARLEAEREERERKAVEQAEAQQRAVREERERKKAEREARAREASAKRRAEMERRAAERKKLSEERRKERERKAQERGEARSLRKSQAPARANKSDNSPSEVRALDDLFPTATPKAASASDEETAKLPAAQSQVRVVRSQDEADALEQTTQAVDVSAFAPSLDRDAEESDSTPPKRAASSGPPPHSTPQYGDDDKFASVRKSEDLSVIVPLPVDMRMDLAPKADKLPPIRVALLDTDLTRADAVAAALRERGLKVHPVTPNVETTRWPILRRFAPQGLVVDEKTMARAAAGWVETFRGDPFLRHVPVILVRFSRLFDDQSTEVTLDPLLHLVEQLGREEFALLDTLAPGCQVDLWLSQVNPYRLVEMLSREDRNTRLDCRSKTERMVWHLGPGYAGRGKLADLKTNEPKKRLSPEEALSWLLSHEECQVAVHQHDEPLAHPSESRDSSDLLREMTDVAAAPQRHESVRPGAPSTPAKAPSFTAAPGSGSSDIPTLASDALISAEAPPRELASSNAPGSPDPEALPMRTRRPLISEEQKEKVRHAARRGRAAVVSAYETYRIKADEIIRGRLGGKLPEQVLTHLHWAAPVVLLLLLIVMLTFSVGGGSEAPIAEKEPTQAEAEDAKAPPKPSPSAEEEKRAAEEAKKADEKTEEPANRWLVEAEEEQPSCEERLGPATPKREDPIKATGYWKNARRLLMVGDMEQAMENMCLAGLLNPKGPASEGLAEYYLGRRSMDEAERWIEESLKADPERRKSLELRADIENQKGNVEEARRLLLDTMRLGGDETKKMELTARKLRQDARLARKGGDLPRAERKLRRAAMLAPRDAQIAAELGDVLFRRKAPKAAALWAQESLEIDPNYSAAMLLSGTIAEARGDKDAAREFYEMVPLGDPYHNEAQRRRSLL